MKIGFVLDDTLDSSDGVQQYILTLGGWLSHSGHEVHFIVGETKRTDIPRVHSVTRNIRVKFNRNRMSIPLLADKIKLKNLLDSERFDILHVQMPYSPTMAGRVVKLAPKQTVIIGTFHILPFALAEKIATRVLGWVLKRNLKRFDEIIAVSAPAARFARRTFKIRPRVIPNTINMRAFQSAKRMRKYDDGKINIVFLGRLVERKGCMELLQALEILHRKHSLQNVRVLIGGKGQMQKELMRFVRDKRLGAIVHFVGFVSEADKANFLASAHVAVFPSLGGESFGIVLLEAMAANVEAVLAGNNAGYKSVLKDHKEQIVRPAKIDEFAKIIKHFITNSAARRRARSWQAKEIANYDIENVGPQILDVYKTAIAKRAQLRDN